MKKTTVVSSPNHCFLLSGVAAALLWAGLTSGVASPLDDFDPPTPTDPSAYTNPPDDPVIALEALKTMPEANEGSLELPDGGVWQ